jgi:hypothetical protein
MRLLSLNVWLVTRLDAGLLEPGDVLGCRDVSDVEGVALGRSQHFVSVLIVYLRHLYSDNY